MNLNQRLIAALEALLNGHEHSGEDITDMIAMLRKTGAAEAIEYATMIARMKTEEEMEDGGYVSEDACSTLSDLIASARQIPAPVDGDLLSWLCVDDTCGESEHDDVPFVYVVGWVPKRLMEGK